MENPSNGFSERPPNGHNGYNHNGFSKNAELSSSEQDKEENFNISWIVNQLLYYKWSFLIIIVGCTLGAGILAWHVQPVYQGSGTLIINSTKNQYSYAGSDISNLLTNSYGLGVGSSFDNQLAIIRSRKIAEETADRVLKYSLMSNGKKYPILWQNYPEDSTSISKEQLVGRIRSKLEVERANDKADLAKVTFESFSPLGAAEMVNLIINTYTDVSTQKNRQSATSARKFLSDQRAKISDSLENAEEALKDFQERTGFVAAESQTTSSFEKLSQLEEEKQQQRIKLSSINTAIENYKDQLQKLRPAFSKNFADNVAPMLSKLQNELSQLEAKRIVLISKNPDLEEHPEREPQLMSLNKQIDALKNNIKERANAVLASTANSGFLSGEEGASRLSTLQQQMIQARVEQAQTKAQISVINKLEAGQKANMDEVPEKALRLARLKRHVEIQESLYKTISQQYAETSLWEQTQFGLGTPLNYATSPSAPIKPNIYAYLLRGFILGLFAGVGFIFLRSTLNTEIDTPERMAEMKYPLLSVIPDFTSNKSFGKHQQKQTADNNIIHSDWITLYDNNSASAEAFRKLQNNILYTRPDERLQTLMITSSKQGEGKTSVTLNLATSLTEAGKKVLVIDSDLRRPNLHRVTGVQKEPGLMNLIFEGKNIEEYILHTQNENLFILPVGKRPPNPSAILRSEKISQILSTLKSRYDYILFDTPPLGIVGDAAPLVRYVDGVLVVSKFKQTDTGDVKNLISELEHLQAPILGTVLTAYDPKRSVDRYYYKTNYYYNYGSYEDYVKEP